MSGKIEISRELLARTYWELDAGTPSIATLAELKVLLAAPAIERHVDFWSWLDYAYRDGSKGEHPKFTKYNMEVAYQVGFTAAPVVERQEPYGFASVLIDAFQYAIDNGKQPTFSKGDLLFFIEQLSKCQSTSPPAPVAVPEGWKLVPIEPTEYMMKVARGLTLQQEQTPSAEYRAMVKAAPACLDKVKELNQ